MDALSALAEDLEWIAVEDAAASGRVRRAATSLAKDLGFREHRAGEVAIAATELATNLYRHASNGNVVLRIRRTSEEAAVELVAIDAGPGIADFGASARDGHTTAGTLGIGLGAAMRLATWFDVHSVPGRGTVIVATFWPGVPPPQRPALAALTRPMSGESVCGDACAQRTTGGVTSLLLADGLGHGELAAVASREAARAFTAESRDERPARTLERLNGIVRSTRGAAMAVARLDPAAATLTFAGVGNVAGWIDDGDRRHALVSSPGIVGSHTKAIREVESRLPPAPSSCSIPTA